MDSMADLRAIAGRVAAFGLASADGEIAVAAESWSRLLTLIGAERLSGLAIAAAEADLLRITEEQTEQLRQQHLDDMTWAVALERSLLAIETHARREGLELVVLKGPVLAHSFYPDASWRPFGDIDLLVRTADWRRACDLLERLGFRRELPEPRPGFDERFGKAAVHADAHGLNVDLHRSLVLGAFGHWIKPEDLFDRTTDFGLAGVGLRRLDDTALLLHACAHASLGFEDPLLMPLRDVLQIALLGSVDWDEFGTLAARWRMRAVVRHAIEAASGILEVEPPEAPLAACGGAIARRERRALADYVTGRRGRGGTARSTLRAVPGVRNKAGLVRAMLFPDHEFLASRAKAGEKPSYTKRWAVPVRWLLRRSR